MGRYKWEIYGRYQHEGFRHVPPISELGERDIGVSGIGIMAATMSCPPARIIVPANASRIRVSMAFASIQERVSCTARSCEARIRSSPQTGAASETDLGADR